MACTENWPAEVNVTEGNVAVVTPFAVTRFAVYDCATGPPATCSVIVPVGGELPAGEGLVLEMPAVTFTEIVAATASVAEEADGETESATLLCSVVK